MIQANTPEPDKSHYALHGEINGAILDNGDFVHLKPEGAKAAKLSLGQKLTVSGKEKPSSTEHRVIEAETVNGKEVRHKKN